MKIFKCPKCDSLDVLEIIYGTPSRDLLLDEEKGKVILGGCSIDENSPSLHCQDCKHEWSKSADD